MTASAASARAQSYLNAQDWPPGKTPFTCFAHSSNTYITCTGSDGSQHYINLNTNTRSTPVTKLLAGIPATDNQVADAVLPNVQPSDLNDALTNPNGSPIETTETNNEKARIVNEINASIGANVTPQPISTSPTPAANFSSTANPDSTTESPFCLYAKVVCDFVDWFKRDDSPPETPDTLPPTVDFIKVPYVASVSNGSCPSPKTLSLGAGSVTFDYSPICQLAISMRPLVIASAGLSALLILTGFNRVRRQYQS